MHRRTQSAYGLLAAGLALVLAGCSPQTGSDAGAVPQPSGTDPGAAKAADPVAASTTRSAPLYAEPGAGVAIAPVAGMRVAQDFKRDYLASPNWKLFAEPDSTGAPLAALVMDGSNKITAAELRIGSSDDAAAMKECLLPPAEATGAGTPATVEIDGVPFTHFSVGDAAMSHYVNAESYRAVREGTCYAVDLVIAGTRPDVYDPPALPPFTQEAAKAKLQEALKAVYWVQ